MIKESCNLREGVKIVVDSFTKALFTDGPSTLVVGGLNFQKISTSVVAGTICYAIRTTVRNCIEPEYDINIAGITLNPYIGGIIGGAAKYILKNPNSPYDMYREGLFGMLNGIGCEAMQDAGMNGTFNRTTSLAVMKAAEGMVRCSTLEDIFKNGVSILKSAEAGAISGLGFTYLYIPAKEMPIINPNHVADSVFELYLLALPKSYDDNI